MSVIGAGVVPWAPEGGLGSLASVSIGVLVVYLLAASAYRALLHPLHDVPGPTLCKITRLPWWIVNYRGDQVSWLRGLHAKYGPVVRYGPNDLSYGTGDAWKSIFGYEKGRSENPKDNNTLCVSDPLQSNRQDNLLTENSIPPIGGVRHMITAAQEEHTRVRRIFSPAFSERALKQQEPLIRKYVTQLVRYLDQTAGDQVNLVDLLNFTTFDIMGDLTFGQPLGLVSSRAKCICLAPANDLPESWTTSATRPGSRPPSRPSGCWASCSSSSTTPSSTPSSAGSSRSPSPT